MKLLIAYSTLAQIGYLFLMFPLAFDASSGEFVRGDALMGGTLQAIVARHREGGDVHGRRPDLQSVRS